MLLEKFIHTTVAAPDRKGSTLAQEREQRELKKNWLLGVLEVGGSVSISVQKDGRILLSIDCNMHPDPAKFAAKILPTEREPYQQNDEGHANVAFRGETLDHLFELIGDEYIAMRQTVDGYFRLLNEAESIDDIEQLKEMRNAITKQGRFEGLTSEAYTKLVTQSAFIAGVLDNRGTVYNLTQRKGINSPTLRVHSKNKALLDALVQIYGGSVQAFKEPVYETEILGRNVTIENQSYYWHLNSGGSRRLLQVVEPHMQRKPYQGWEVLVSAQRREAKETLASEIEAYMEQQIELFEKGETSRLPSIATLAAHFEIEPIQYDNMRNKYLDKDVVNKYYELSNKVNQSKFTNAEIVELGGRVERELIQYMTATENGEPHLKFAHEWLALLASEGIGIGRATFDRYLEKTLPAETLELRVSILKRQQRAILSANNTNRSNTK